jgi:hypothetical protein
VDNKEFQKRALGSFTRLENDLVGVKGGQEDLKKDIQFLHDDMTSKFEMLANAIKEVS